MIPKCYLPSVCVSLPRALLHCLINPNWFRLDQIRHAAVESYGRAQAHMDMSEHKTRRLRARGR